MASPDLQSVIQVFSGAWSPCPLCSETGGAGYGPVSDEADVATRVNHLLSEHDCELLHVGQQTQDGADGPWQLTTAVLGVPTQVVWLRSRHASGHR